MLVSAGVQAVTGFGEVVDMVTTQTHHLSGKDTFQPGELC